MNIQRHRLSHPRRVVLLGVLVSILALGLALALGGGLGRGPSPGAGSSGGGFDPLVYSPARRAFFEQAAAAGLSHVIYAKTPGGVLAAAKRTATLRPAVETAAARGPIDADTLEAMILLESAGRPDVLAGADPSAAAGLTQIVAQTGSGLLGMRVDLAASRRLTRRIAASPSAAAAAALRAQRARVDQRFDPVHALAATERYLKIAKGVFGREDLAVESYHMGIGNLETAARRYAGSGAPRQTAKLVAERDLSYTRLYVDSTPLAHASAYTWLAALGDDSATYLWRVAAAREVMRLYRRDPARLAAQAALQTGARSAELALRPPAQTPVLTDAAAVAAGRRSDALVPLPSGAAAIRLGLLSDGPFVLRGDALAAAVYLAAAVRAIGHSATALEVTAATTAAVTLPSAARASRGRADRDRLHATGYAFDLARSYASPAQAQALQFTLERLQTLAVIAWQRHKHIIHVVVGPRAGQLRGKFAAGRSG